MLSPPMSSHLHPNGSEWPHSRQKQRPLFLIFLHLLLQQYLLFPSLSSHLFLCSLPPPYPSSLPPSFPSFLSPVFPLLLLPPLFLSPSYLLFFPSPSSLSLPSFLSYEEFLKETNELNKLDTYPQLLSRARHIGYHVTKVVYRGYEASVALQVCACNDGPDPPLTSSFPSLSLLLLHSLFFILLSIHSSLPPLPFLHLYLPTPPSPSF